jgi:hypothetical protein
MTAPHVRVTVIPTRLGSPFGFGTIGGGAVVPPVPGLPTSLDGVNDILSTFGAVASNAWGLDELSGDAVDMAETGAVPLTPSGSPTQGVITGLSNGDRGVQLADNGDAFLAAPNSSVLEPATGDAFLLFTFRLISASTTRMLLGKRQATSRGHYIQITNTGRVDWVLIGAGGVVQSNGATGHFGEEYHDGLAVLDRSGGAAIITDLGSSSVNSVATLGDISATGTFRVGPETSTVFGPAAVVTFLARGTSVGSLLADRVAALEAWRAARGA